jgi:uncharacterized protein (TIGR03435 family)
MRKATIRTALLIFTSTLAYSQTFDAASVKPTAPPDSNGMVRMGTDGGPGTKDPARIRYGYLTVRSLLMIAFNVKTFQISGPASIDTERFDIVATLSPRTTPEQLNVMLQNLLAERFKIKLHRETRDLPMYSLIVAKGGPKMKVSAEVPAPRDDAEPAPSSGRPKIGPDGFVRLEEIPADRPIGITTWPDRARMMGRQKTMEELADRLTAIMSRPVIDATALKGKYDLSLTFSPEGLNGLGSPMPAATSPDADPLPDIFGALQEQFGLKLEPKKGPVDMIVIDHIEKTPTGN